MNRFGYSITTHFIPDNKDYYSCCNPHSVYQTYPKTHELYTTNYRKIHTACKSCFNNTIIIIIVK